MTTIPQNSVQAAPKQVPLAAGRPLIGSMIEMQRDPFGAFKRAFEEHGDVVRFVAGPPGMRMDLHVVFSATGARQVLAKDAANFRKDNKFYRETRDALGNGLLTSQDEEYLRQRRLVQPLFTQRQVDKYAGVMIDEVEHASKQWRGEVDVVGECTRLTLKVVARILFGSDVDAAVDTIRRAFPVIGADLRRRGFDEPRSIPRGWPTPANRSFKSAQRELHAVCDRIVEERRRRPDPEADDLLSLLARAGTGTETGGDSLASEEVRDQVLVFLLAGHETTATSLTFALHLLGHHPDVQAKAYEEVQRVLGDREPTSADLPRLPYLTMVMKETMRLYPAAPAIGRRAVEESVVDGYLIPAGADVMVSPWMTHRHPAYWSEPEAYRPERFAPGGEAEQTPHAWLPFSSGPRACIGQHFSMLESVLALAVLVRAHEFESIDQEVPVTFGITLAATGPVRSRVTPRV